MDSGKKQKNVRNNPVNAKVSEEGETGIAPGDRAEIPSSLKKRDMMEQISMLQLMEDPLPEQRKSVRRMERRRGAVVD